LFLNAKVLVEKYDGYNRKTFSDTFLNVGIIVYLFVVCQFVVLQGGVVCDCLMELIFFEAVFMLLSWLLMK
jgi:hypothetical protein